MRVAAHVRSGDLCKNCGSRCARDFEDGAITLACPTCNERGCERCDGGYFELKQCPRQYVGNEITEAINLASMCGQGDWPVAGGLLDQSAWFLDLKQTIDSEDNKIATAKSE